MNDVETTNNELKTFIERFKVAHDNDIAEFAKAEVIPFSSFQPHILHPLKYYNQYGISTLHLPFIGSHGHLIWVKMNITTRGRTIIQNFATLLRNWI